MLGVVVDYIARPHYLRPGYIAATQMLTTFMMKTTKSVTTLTAPILPRFRAMSQKAFFDDLQKDVLKIATFKQLSGHKMTEGAAKIGVAE